MFDEKRARHLSLREQFKKANSTPDLERGNDGFGDPRATEKEELYAGARVEITLRIANILRLVYERASHNPQCDIELLAKTIKQESASLPNLKILHKFGESLLAAKTQQQSNLRSAIDIEEDPSWDDATRDQVGAAIFRQQTNKEPSSTVRYLSSPLCLALACYDPDDYAAIYGDPTASSTGGFFRAGSVNVNPAIAQSTPDLIVLSSPEDLVHETGHALINIVKKTLAAQTNLRLQKIMPLFPAITFAEFLTPDSSRSELSEQGKLWFGTQAQDELLADFFYHGNFTHFYSLKNDAIYDFLRLEWPHVNPNSEKVQAINSAYHHFLDNSVAWARVIQLRCSRYPARANLVPWILMQHPMSEWETVGRWFELEASSHEDSDTVHTGLINTLDSLEETIPPGELHNKVSAFLDMILDQEEQLHIDLCEAGLSSQVSIGHRYRTSTREKLLGIKQMVASSWGVVDVNTIKWDDRAISPEILREDGLIS